MDKSNKEIYYSVVKKLGCEFEECIVIDDKVENVEVAENIALMDLLCNEFIVA